MLRVNVATRPFYNERRVHLFLTVIALLLVATSVVNVVALRRLSGREADLTARTAEQERRARELRQQATRVRSTIRQDELNAVVIAAREANGLIDQRTFSWTQLLTHLETTLPDDVMLTSVRPATDSGQLLISLGVIGRRVQSLDEFMTRLEDTHAFRNVLSRDEQTQDDGTYAAILVGEYVLPNADGPATDPAAPEPATEGGP
jgi:hypothetical protein